jgi:hypothetical protein
MFEQNRNFMIKHAKAVFDGKRAETKDFINNYKERFKCQSGCNPPAVAKYIVKDIKVICSQCRVEIIKNEGYLKC